MELILILAILFFTEVKLKPRIAIIKKNNSKHFILWYSIISKYDKKIIFRDYLLIFKF